METMTGNSRNYEKEIQVLRLIHARVSLSRAELVKLTGLSAGLISALVRRLIGMGLVVESGLEPAKLGRRRISLRIKPEMAYTMGVEIGTYHMRVVVNDLAGNVRHKLETLTVLNEGMSRVMARCFETISGSLQACGLSKEAIAAIGIAHSGVTDSEKGLVLSFPRPGQMTEWRSVPLREMVEKEFGVPCFLEDSVRMAALAEKQLGICTNLADFIYIRIGMGIGGCIFIKGEPYRGPGGNAGEFGHMTVDEDGPMCSCGSYGCLSALASCTAIIQAMTDAIRKGVHSRVQEMTEDDLARINIEMIIQAANENDSLAFRVLNDAAMHIGVALADVVNFLNPAMVVFGGPLFQVNAPYVLETIQRVIKQRALEKAANDVQLMVAELGGEAAALGAARYAADMSIEKLYLRGV